MTRFHPDLLVILGLGMLALSCTDAGLYAIGGRGGGGPDRADFSGIGCVPLAAGDAFPVKVLFAVQAGSQGIPVGEMTDALNSIVARFPLPYISFALITYHGVATGIQGSFVPASTFANAIPRYNAQSGDGPPSMRNALRLARSILSGEMVTGCRGVTARTRYLVVLLNSTYDTSCANPAFNAGLDSTCLAAPTAADCSACELDKATRELTDLMQLYGAGEVSVQPIYVPPDPSAPHPDALTAVRAVARAGGTQVLQTPAPNLTGALNGLNYASLQRALALKRIVGFNRSALSIAGALYADTDGDGVSDPREAELTLDPIKPDTDDDGIMDGVEIRMGMNPLVADTITGCNRYGDIDLDRLNDCEERVLGTDSCVADTDGDALPDLVEALSRTNPLVPEDLRDTDGDGISNAEEVMAHTDPQSVDNDYRSQRAYGYEWSPAEPTDDGRPCFQFRIDNISLTETLTRPNDPFPAIPSGTNDIYLYIQVGRQNEPHGAGIGSLTIQQVRYTAGPPARRTPGGTIKLGPDDFVLGN
jgi:hypothetical protein